MSQPGDGGSRKGALFGKRARCACRQAAKGARFACNARALRPWAEGRRAAEFSPALCGRRAFENAGARGASGRGSPGGLMRKTDARRWRQAFCSGCGRLVWGAKFRAECDKDIARDFARGKVCRTFMGKTQSKGARFGRRGRPARAANEKSAAALSAGARPLQARENAFRRLPGKMRWQGRIARASIYFFFFFCARRHCQGGVGSLSCQRPRRSLRAMASSSFQVLQMSLVQK